MLQRNLSLLWWIIWLTNYDCYHKTVKCTPKYPILLFCSHFTRLLTHFIIILLWTRCRISRGQCHERWAYQSYTNIRVARITCGITQTTATEWETFYSFVGFPQKLQCRMVFLLLLLLCILRLSLLQMVFLLFSVCLCETWAIIWSREAIAC